MGATPNAQRRARLRLTTYRYLYVTRYRMGLRPAVRGGGAAAASAQAGVHVYRLSRLAARTGPATQTVHQSLHMQDSFADIDRVDP